MQILQVLSNFYTNLWPFLMNVALLLLVVVFLKIIESSVEEVRTEDEWTLNDERLQRILRKIYEKQIARQDPNRIRGILGRYFIQFYWRSREFQKQKRRQNNVCESYENQGVP